MQGDKADFRKYIFLVGYRISNPYAILWSEVLPMAKVIGITEKKCKKCGHQWIPRSTQEPLICPKCKSPRWKLGPKKVK